MKAAPTCFSSDKNHPQGTTSSA